MLEWPIARRSNQSQQSQIPTEIFLREYHGKDSIVSTQAFDKLSKTLIKSYRLKLPAKGVISQLIGLCQPIPEIEDEASFVSSSDVALVLACVRLIHKRPETNAWRYLWSLAWHSALLERELPRVATAIAKQDKPFKAALLKVASTLIKENAVEPGRRTPPRDRALLHQFRKAWKERPTLAALWWGLREADSLPFRDESDGMFSIVAELDARAFIDILSSLDNPYPVHAALLFAHAGWSFDKWQTLLCLSPTAFDDDGTWNGSTIVPLLLFIARDQLQQVRVDLGAADQEQAVKDAEVEVHRLAKQIAEALHSKPDAAPCAKRWTTWLMRQSVSGIAGDTVPLPLNIKSHGYIDIALIQALGTELEDIDWKPSTAKDSEPWESWCYRCVLVSLVQTGCSVPLPDPDDFLQEWSLTPEDWESESGEDLRARSSIFTTFGNRPDAYGTRLLAAGLAQAREGPRIFSHLWDAAQPIREIVEYGNADQRINLNSRVAATASGLMRLLFGLGLMMLDSLVDLNSRVAYDRQSALTELLPLLFDAHKEMRAIDRFNSGFWDQALRHLALRRAMWTAGTKGLATGFRAGSKPTLRDFIHFLSCDTENLLAFLEVATRNGVTRQQLHRPLSEIDLSARISFAERLIKLTPKRANVSAEQLKAARSFL